MTLEQALAVIAYLHNYPHHHELWNAKIHSEAWGKVVEEAEKVIGLRGG